jgi:hypothetical protein
MFEPGGDPSAVTELLGNLSLSLSSIALACVIGAAVILKERSAGKKRFYPVAFSIVTVGACLVAVYAGFRFQIALAEQISLYQLNMELIQDRLETQAAAALAGASSTIALAVESFVLPPAPAQAQKPKQPTPPRKRPKPRTTNAP